MCGRGDILWSIRLFLEEKTNKHQISPVNWLTSVHVSAVCSSWFIWKKAVWIWVTLERQQYIFFYLSYRWESVLLCCCFFVVVFRLFVFNKDFFPSLKSNFWNCNKAFRAHQTFSITGIRKTLSTPSPNIISSSHVWCKAQLQRKLFLINAQPWPSSSSWLQARRANWQNLSQFSG